MEYLIIKWRDSNIYLSQHNPDDSDYEIATITSVGLCLEETPSHIVLAGDKLNDGDVRRVIVIPLENVIETKLLQISKNQ